MPAARNGKRALIQGPVGELYDRTVDSRCACAELGGEKVEVEVMRRREERGESREEGDGDKEEGP